MAKEIDLDAIKAAIAILESLVIPQLPATATPEQQANQAAVIYGCNALGPLVAEVERLRAELALPLNLPPKSDHPKHSTVVTQDRTKDGAIYYSVVCTKDCGWVGGVWPTFHAAEADGEDHEEYCSAREI
jgi:hypothetical protein